MATVHDSFSRDKLRTQAESWLRRHGNDASRPHAHRLLSTFIDRQRATLTRELLETPLANVEGMLTNRLERELRGPETDGLDLVLRALQHGMEQCAPTNGNPEPEVEAAAEDAGQSSKGVFRINMGRNRLQNTSEKLPLPPRGKAEARSVIERDFPTAQRPLLTKFWRQLEQKAKALPGGIQPIEVDGITVQAGYCRAQGAIPAVYMLNESVTKVLKPHIQAQWEQLAAEQRQQAEAEPEAEDLAASRATKAPRDPEKLPGINRNRLYADYPELRSEVSAFWASLCHAFKDNRDKFEEAELDNGLTVRAMRAWGGLSGFYVEPDCYDTVVRPHFDQLLHQKGIQRAAGFAAMIAAEDAVPRKGNGTSRENFQGLGTIVTAAPARAMITDTLQRAYKRAERGGELADDNSCCFVADKDLDDKESLTIRFITYGNNSRVMVHDSSVQAVREWAERIKAMSKDARGQYHLRLRRQTTPPIGEARTV